MFGIFTSMVYIAVPLVFGSVSTFGSLLAPISFQASGSFGLNGPADLDLLREAGEFAERRRLAGRGFDDALVDA